MQQVVSVIWKCKLRLFDHITWFSLSWILHISPLRIHLKCRLILASHMPRDHGRRGNVLQIWKQTKEIQLGGLATQDDPSKYWQTADADRRHAFYTKLIWLYNEHVQILVLITSKSTESLKNQIRCFTLFFPAPCSLSSNIYNVSFTIPHLRINKDIRIQNVWTVRLSVCTPCTICDTSLWPGFKSHHYLLRW